MKTVINASVANSKTSQNRFLSMITHDLKSPLAAIEGFADHLREEMADSQAKQAWIDIVERIYTASRQSAKLAADILTMAKVEAGREMVELNYVLDLRHELSEILETFIYEARAKNIKLELSCDAKLPPVLWDMHRIRLHVLNNLISNALKFTPENGVITLSATRRPDSKIEISVSDTGPGIPNDAIDKIFEPYEQLNLDTERVKTGSGLGLYNAKLFVTRHCGKIWCHNNQNTGGAIFSLQLPINPADCHKGDDSKWCACKTEQQDSTGYSI